MRVPPPTFHLVINLKAAKALGLTIPPAVLARAIPPAVLARAAEVIE